MKKEEIEAFIAIMKEIHEEWTPDQVKEVYGTFTLREALDKRMSMLQAFYDFAGEVVKPDIEKL